MSSLIRLIMSFLWVFIPSVSVAQVRGENSSEFFKEDQEQMQEQIEQMENQRQNEEDNLEQTLEIEKPKHPDFQEVQDNPESLDENVPEGSEQEVEIKF